jgi:23S rRNA (cytidine1920-2'-O)/16S rRNA (cytidine1409-2'-O)-methyltransferase
MNKTRLDQLLVSRGYFETREKARRVIMAGGVRVGGKVIDKPGKSVSPDSDIKIADRPRYVSRGGEKLEAAIRKFGVEVSGKKCLDIGASTGGFTDCLLQHGARQVAAVDVGYGQIAQNLRSDPRVKLMERVNARYLRPADLPYAPELVTVDVSFISLSKILPVIGTVAKSGAEVVALIKPQFEAGPKDVKKGGVVKDSRVHSRIIWNICELSEGEDFIVRGLMQSPLKGPAGNKEFFIYLLRP